jgi:serine/threonine protein kinase
MAGHVLGGRYEIRGVLGRGGMGEVWLARDLKLQVEVALKVVRPERLADPLALERLRAEVRSARAVASPHVCRVYDLVEAEGLECVSMEYVDGTTLRHVLETRSPLELGEAREITLQLLAGLGAIHEAGLVHRDVKPENVMLTRARRVVLMDFGIAKAVATGGTVAGTPAYWAPEQAMGAPADPRADVFAAGIVLAEMVATSGVRDSERRQALWQAVREDPPRVADTPWSEAIARAVAREPGDRCVGLLLRTSTPRRPGKGLNRARPPFLPMAVFRPLRTQDSVPSSALGSMFVSGIGTMTVAAGSRLGPYEIVTLLGASGMGEVEPSCGRERSGSPQAKSRGKRGIPC